MALSGLHVACCFGGTRSQPNLPVISKPIWSEYMATANTSSNAAVSGGIGRTRQAIFRITSGVDALVCIDKTPNASTGYTHEILAGIQYDIVVETGDKLAWIAA